MSDHLAYLKANWRPITLGSFVFASYILAVGASSWIVGNAVLAVASTW